VESAVEYLEAAAAGLAWIRRLLAPLLPTLRCCLLLCSASSQLLQMINPHLFTAPNPYTQPHAHTQPERGALAKASAGPISSDAAMPLVYSAVARGSAVLADYSVFAGNFNAVAKDYLSKATSTGRFSYTADNHVFSFLAEDGYSELDQGLLRRWREGR